MNFVANKVPSGRMREPRVSVHISVRVKSDFGSETAEVCNVSSRGIMITGASPPPRGTYVEISHGSKIVIGRIAWASSDRFGVFTQDRIVLAELMSASAASLAGSQKRQTVDEVRLSPHRRDTNEIAASSTRLARSFEFVVIAVAAAAAAMALAYAASELLSSPLQKVGAAMN